MPAFAMWHETQSAAEWMARLFHFMLIHSIQGHFTKNHTSAGGAAAKNQGIKIIWINHVDGCCYRGISLVEQKICSGVNFLVRSSQSCLFFVTYLL